MSETATPTPGTADAGGSGQGTVVGVAQGLAQKLVTVGILGCVTREIASDGSLLIDAIFVYPNFGVYHYTETIDPTQRARMELLVPMFADPLALENKGDGPITITDIGNVNAAMDYSKVEIPSPPQVAQIARGFDVDMSGSGS